MRRAQPSTTVEPIRARRPARPARPAPAPARAAAEGQPVEEVRGNIWWLIAACLLFLLGTSPAWVLMYFWVEF